MNANQPDDAHSDPHASELSSKAELTGAASKLRVYGWERFIYTDAANTALSESLTRWKALLRSIIW
jgi:hypothetical protein